MSAKSMRFATPNSIAGRAQDQLSQKLEPQISGSRAMRIQPLTRWSHLARGSLHIRTAENPAFKKWASVVNAFAILRSFIRQKLRQSTKE